MAELTHTTRSLYSMASGTDLGGGYRGCAPLPPPPEMTCGFLIQLVFCKKRNKLCGLLVLKQSKRRVHPLLKKSWIRPWAWIGEVVKSRCYGSLYSGTKRQPILFFHRSTIMQMVVTVNNRKICYHGKVTLVTLLSIYSIRFIHSVCHL